MANSLKKIEIRLLWERVNQLEEEICTLQLNHNKSISSITTIMDILVEHKIIIQRNEDEMVFLHESIENI